MSLYLLHLFLVFLFAILFLMGGSRLFPVVLLGDLSWPSQTKSLHSNLCILNFHVAVSHSVYVYSSVDQFIGRNVHIWIRRVHPSLFLNVCFSLSLTLSLSICFICLHRKNIYICVISLYLCMKPSVQFIYMHLFYIHPFIFPSTHPSIHLFICTSTCLLIYLPI